MVLAFMNAVPNSTEREFELSFRVEEMNDILKSLTTIEWGKGKVLGIDYATPQSLEERLEGCSIHLNDARSLQDLITGLRGREVRLILDQGEEFSGTLIGLDQAPQDQPLGSGLVSILLNDSNLVKTLPLSRLLGLDILDERGANDLRFFLHTSLSQEKYRQVTIRLSPGEHELSISYIAPAPTWRVSYRLVTDTLSQDKKSLLLGWGIFDNRLEEDLDGISLSLVAGMPISFVYDLYTPFTPERPIVKEETRVASGPVDFEAQTLRSVPQAAPAPSMAYAVGGGLAPAPQRSRQMVEAIQDSAPVNVVSKDMGELFQYVIQTPVTVGRGQSAMVPIISSHLDFRKDLLYNSNKIPKHPVATLRLKNATGLSLERGPVTVLENGEYVGEAVLPFTTAENEIVVPYAVELGIKIKEEFSSREEIHSLHLQAGYLLVEVWEVLCRTYQVNNTTGQKQIVLIEHQRKTNYDLFDSPEPKEKSPEQLRFEVEAPPMGEYIQEIKERRLVSRREELRRQSLDTLSRYVKQGLMDTKVYNKIAELLHMWERIADLEKELGLLDKECEKIYKAQQQIQGNMGALGNSGREGDLRVRYVGELEATEERLQVLREQDLQMKSEMQKVEKEIQAKIQALG